MKVEFTIYSEMAQKGNSRRIVTNRLTGKQIIAKSAKAVSWAHSATNQLIDLGLLMGLPTIIEDVRITVHAYYANDRSDLDISVLRDVMQTRYSGKGKGRRVVVSGLIENDRQIKEEHNFHHIDADNPRAEVVIEIL